MIVDKIENAYLYKDLISGIDMAFDYIKKTDFSNFLPGKYEIEGEDLFALVSEYETQEEECLFPEAHKKYIDVQFMISGEELIGYVTMENQPLVKPYTEVDDYALYNSAVNFLHLKTNMFAIFFPQDLHLPCIKIDEIQMVKKVVVKVMMDKSR